MKKSRVEYLDIVRGICIIYMVAGHIGFQSVFFDHYIHAFHMPIFFVISGFFYKSSTMTFFEFIKKHTKKLLLPYLFWALLFLLIDNYTSIGYHYGIKNGLYSILLFNNNRMPIAGALWFLTSFYFSSLIFFILEKNIKNKKLLGVLCMILLLIGVYLKKVFNIELIWSLNSSLVGVGLLYMGYILKNKNIIDKLNIKNIFILIPTIVVHFISIKYTGYVNMRISSYPFFIFFIFNVIISCVVYISISNRIIGLNEFIKKFLMMLGKESMIALCLNQFIIRIVRMIIVGDFQYGKVIIFAISLVIITLLVYLLRNSKLKILFGK